MRLESLQFFISRNGKVINFSPPHAFVLTSYEIPSTVSQLLSVVGLSLDSARLFRVNVCAAGYLNDHHLHLPCGCPLPGHVGLLFPHCSFRRLFRQRSQACIPNQGQLYSIPLGIDN